MNFKINKHDIYKLPEGRFFYKVLSIKKNCITLQAYDIRTRYGNIGFLAPITTKKDNKLFKDENRFYNEETGTLKQLHKRNSLSFHHNFE